MTHGTARASTADARVRADPLDADAAVQARGRALSSPTRVRVLRLCRFEARTNKELAELLGVNPGTMLHHVRTLVQTGFLAPEPERSGAQGAREVPYRATGLSWRSAMPQAGSILVQTFLQQIEGLAPEDLDVSWLGLSLNAASRVELETRLSALLQEFADRDADADGEPYSLFTALHPDLNPPAPDRVRHDAATHRSVGEKSGGSSRLSSAGAPDAAP